MDEILAVGNGLFVDRDMTEPHVLPVAGGVACVYSARCPGKDSANEDSAAVLPAGETAAVLVVADGLGGAAAGEHASRLAVERMRGAIEAANETETPLRSAIINGLEQANNAVRELGVGAGCTLAAVQVDGLTIRPYHVGDCEILVTGSRGKIKLQTVAHSPVGYGVEAGLLDEIEAMHHEDRHIVSNIIGSEDMRIEIGPPRTLQVRDTVLLASDGLFDNLSVDEIVAHIRKGPLTKAAGAMCATLRRRMSGAEDGRPSKPDDATFIAYRPRQV